MLKTCSGKWLKMVIDGHHDSNVGLLDRHDITQSYTSIDLVHRSLFHVAIYFMEKKKYQHKDRLCQLKITSI